MSLTKCALIVLLTAVPLFAQEQGGLSTRNPLDEIRDELTQVLSDAQVPFTEAQQSSIALVLEESRRASEELFGDVMNFSSGPPKGEQLDRARSGIQWMNDDFSKRVRRFLTDAQIVVWDKHLTEKNTAAPKVEGGSTAGTKAQVQQIRVNNNPFTPENQFFGFAGSGGSYGFAGGGGVSTEVFQRGGSGAWHGTYELRVRDESLNARNPFSTSRSPYQQRNININTSGPLIRNRLTITGSGSQSQQDNADTVHAQTPQGLVELGFTRPVIFRDYSTNGTYQINDTQMLQFTVSWGMNRFENQGVGGFSLPERASSSSGGYRNLNFRHLWFISPSLVQDISFSSNNNHNETIPATAGVAINVNGAFNGGGNPNQNQSQDQTNNLRTLWIRTGERASLRFGGGFFFAKTSQVSQDNFLGTFTFSDLASYSAQLPITYKVTRGIPQLDVNQKEYSLFFREDLKVSSRLTVFMGVRDEFQTNLKDWNNVDPRLGLAFALQNSTVLRAGVGVFHMRVDRSVDRELRRLDGTRQFEIVVNNPSYPDPFQSGTVTVVPPSSRRVKAADLAAPYQLNMSVVLERSLPRNLFVTASYDYDRGYHLLRSRDLNGILPGQTSRPDPSQGNVWHMESSGVSSWNAFRVTMRQRFSIFNMSGNYTRQVNRGDSQGAFNSPSDNNNLRSDWASWVSQSFNMSLNSRLPFGVFLTTNISANSGNSYTVTTGKDDNGDGVTNDRPLGVRRNSEYGPGWNNLGFNLSKAVSFGKPANGGSAPNLNVFANINNALNRTNLGTPSGVMTSSFFKKSFNAFNPRDIEVGLRFQF